MLRAKIGPKDKDRTMNIGVIINLSKDEAAMQRVVGFGLNVCQVACWDMSLATKEVAEAVVANSKKTGVKVCGVWGGWPGPGQWNFTAGPTTLGLVPPEYREERVKALKKWSDFAEMIGCDTLITHCGFIPENMTDPEYAPVADAIIDVAKYCDAKGQKFLFETGQETPVVILRVIERSGLTNMGVNLDPANLILYGKANPIDALDVFGKFVKQVHVKDGLYPTNGNELGCEVPPGKGRVRFPEFIKRLKEVGFDGELVIEREIEGEQQAKDIQAAVADLRGWIAQA